MESLIEEAAVAGNLTARRAQFQFGGSLPVGERGTIDYGQGAIEHNDIATSGDVKALSDLWALLVDFQTGFGVVEPGTRE